VNSARQLAAEGIVFRRGRRRVLDGANLAFSGGEIVSLLGSNGAGKTTLLRIMLGLIAPDEGSVKLDGAPIANLRRRELARRIAYVPQGHNAPFPYLVREVVALGRFPAQGFFGRTVSADAKAVGAILANLRIAHLADRTYTHLSGGERQLVMIARALAQDASLLVMDEPLSGLDYGHQIELLRSLRDLAAQGFGILMTTHHPDQALMVSTRIATLVDGRIDADGAPRDVITPETIRRLYGVTLAPDEIPAQGLLTTVLPNGT